VASDTRISFLFFAFLREILALRPRILSLELLACLSMILILDADAVFAGFDVLAR